MEGILGSNAFGKFWVKSFIMGFHKVFTMIIFSEYFQKEHLEFDSS